mmetsp:Transcript_27706/g.58643  ORF Transcript_27706/g.58643 Transcript_27706/m.58643 type:complete len:91 (-) Transcript_27706:1525-1797(-)
MLLLQLPLLLLLLQTVWWRSKSPIIPMCRATRWDMNILEGSSSFSPTFDVSRMACPTMQEFTSPLFTSELYAALECKMMCGALASIKTLA